MRGHAWLPIAVVLAAACPDAAAESLPPGSMGLVFGGVSGTGKDASRIGYGYVEPLRSFEAAWQPMTTERRIGWTLRWTTVFADYYGASAAQVADLATMQMDIAIGVRVRPWSSPKRYLTAGGGPALFRANQTIPPKLQRAFLGAIANVGIQQYLFGTRLLVDLDVRYGLIGDGPRQITLVAGISITGP